MKCEISSWDTGQMGTRHDARHPWTMWQCLFLWHSLYPRMLTLIFIFKFCKHAQIQQWWIFLPCIYFSFYFNLWDKSAIQINKNLFWGGYQVKQLVIFFQFFFLTGRQKNKCLLVRKIKNCLYDIFKCFFKRSRPILRLMEIITVSSDVMWSHLWQIKNLYILMNKEEQLPCRSACSYILKSRGKEFY